MTNIYLDLAMYFVVVVVLVFCAVISTICLSIVKKGFKWKIRKIVDVHTMTRWWFQSL